MSKTMTLLWGAGSPPCWRVMIVLEEKKLQGYKHKLLSFEKGEHKSKEVLEVNPRGQLPAFKHGSNILNESVAACLYLESQFKTQGIKLIPDNPTQQALVYQRMMEGLTLTEKLNSVIYYDWSVPEEERHESAVKRNREALTTELRLWEGYLQKVAAGSYLAGSFSMADVVIFPNVAYAFRFGLSVGRYPKLAKYYSLLKDRPSIKASRPPQWMASSQGYDILKDL
ncbi:glutathione S-transferase rho isoform X1 [Takifugu rubripes]|uniref:Glutathione S-transferase rho n=2 Tax=Takifugu TaxID=31032 RepID=H2ULP6_TAKRU|nr:glutathione S-transferase A-like isoform X1 [Takifugu rubripes]XP_056876537.1 glutathione S-transferase A-like [Takifugu flavidus]TWW65365.1 Glutathione S-transferase A [Takifugu flavidus]|eukprot:XP_003969015.1 PREDICTED: glutathione S-transferase A-like [Takifugu rubripes]